MVSLAHAEPSAHVDATSKSFAFPLNSSSLSLTLVLRSAFSRVRSLSCLESALCFSLRASSSPFAAFRRDWNWPVDLNASANSLRSWAITSNESFRVGPSLIAAAGVVCDTVAPIFAASRTVIRSASRVSDHCQSNLVMPLGRPTCVN